MEVSTFLLLSHCNLARLIKWTGDTIVFEIYQEKYKLNLDCHANVLKKGKSKTLSVLWIYYISNRNDTPQ